MKYTVSFGRLSNHAERTMEEHAWDCVLWQRVLIDLVPRSERSWLAAFCENSDGVS